MLTTVTQRVVMASVTAAKPRSFVLIEITEGLFRCVCWLCVWLVVSEIDDGWVDGGVSKYVRTQPTLD